MSLGKYKQNHIPELQYSTKAIYELPVSTINLRSAQKVIVILAGHPLRKVVGFHFPTRQIAHTLYFHNVVRLIITTWQDWSLPHENDAMF